MPKRKRHRPGGVDPAELARTDDERAVQLFARRKADEEQARRDARRAAKAARAAVARTTALLAAKDEAAARLKGVRRSDRGGDDLKAAEAAYRDALAAVLADERGEPAPAADPATADAGQTDVADLAAAGQADAEGPAGTGRTDAAGSAEAGRTDAAGSAEAGHAAAEPAHVDPAVG